MFLGRSEELEALESRYRMKNFQFVVLYGRRRVGKTELINQFKENKPSIFLAAVDGSDRMNLANLSRSIVEFETNRSQDVLYPDWQAALDHVFQLSCEKQLVLAIDEYPNAARCFPSLASILQHMIDKYHKSSRLFLILCGSAMTYMEDHVMAYTAALHGRITGRIKLEPLPFEDVSTYCSAMSYVDRVNVFGILGGVPQYLMQFQPSQSIAENVKRLFLDRSSILYEEPGNILRQEVREDGKYAAVLNVIANGASSSSEIADKCGYERSLCTSYLRTLVSLNILKREVPYGNKKSKKPVYTISDPMFRFWYRFIPGLSSTIHNGMRDSAWSRIESCLSEYMGPAFEDVCKEFLWKLLKLGQSPVDFCDLGSWWGYDPAAESEVEMDIVGDDGNGGYLFGECKWTNRNVDRSVLEKLIQRSNLIPCLRKHFVLFAKTGFTEGCRSLACQLGIVSLFTLDDMMEIAFS